jgi:hypothetical protein
VKGPDVALYLSHPRVAAAGLSKPGFEVYRQFVVMARPSGEVRWALGDNQLHRMTRYSVSSVRRARRELVHKGLLLQLQAGTGRDRSQYALVPLTAALEASMQAAVGAEDMALDHPPAGVDAATGEVLDQAAVESPSGPPRVVRLNTQGGHPDHPYTRAGGSTKYSGPSGYHPPTPLRVPAAAVSTDVPDSQADQERLRRADPPRGTGQPSPARRGGCKKHPARAKPSCQFCRATPTPERIGAAASVDACLRHPGQRAPSCPGCRADRIARPDSPDERRSEEGEGRPPLSGDGSGAPGNGP